MSHYCETSKPFCLSPPPPPLVQAFWTVRRSCSVDRPWTRTTRIGENIYIYLLYKRGQQTRTGTVVMVFNVFGHRFVQLSDPRLRCIYRGILCIYIIILLCIWSLGPSIVLSDVSPRIIHTVSAAAAAPIHVIYSFIKQQTEGCRAKYHLKDSMI